MSSIPSIKQIRKEYQYKGFYSQFLNDHFLAIFSPYFTCFFIKNGVVPNVVTTLMIIFGIIGAVLFSLPCISLKICGIFFIFLWYIMDLSDGEVARIMKKFSKYGKELDYTAHMIDHPFFTVAFAINVIQEPVAFIILIVSLGLVDSVFRGLQSFEIIYKLKEDINLVSSEKEQYGLVRFFKYLFLNLSTFPLFAMVFPMIFLVSKNVAFWYLMMTLFATVVITWLSVLRWLKRII